MRCEKGEVGRSLLAPPRTPTSACVSVAPVMWGESGWQGTLRKDGASFVGADLAEGWASRSLGPFSMGWLGRGIGNYTLPGRGCRFTSLCDYILVVFPSFYQYLQITINKYTPALSQSSSRKQRKGFVFLLSLLKQEECFHKGQCRAARNSKDGGNGHPRDENFMDRIRMHVCPQYETGQSPLARLHCSLIQFTYHLFMLWFINTNTTFLKACFSQEASLPTPVLSSFLF